MLETKSLYCRPVVCLTALLCIETFYVGENADARFNSQFVLLQLAISKSLETIHVRIICLYLTRAHKKNSKKLHALLTYSHGTQIIAGERDQGLIPASHCMLVRRRCMLQRGTEVRWCGHLPYHLAHPHPPQCRGHHLGRGHRRTLQQCKPLAQRG